MPSAGRSPSVKADSDKSPSIRRRPSRIQARPVTKRPARPRATSNSSPDGAVATAQAGTPDPMRARLAWRRTEAPERRGSDHSNRPPRVEATPAPPARRDSRPDAMRVKVLPPSWATTISAIAYRSPLAPARAPTRSRAGPNAALRTTVSISTFPSSSAARADHGRHERRDLRARDDVSTDNSPATGRASPGRRRQRARNSSGSARRDASKRTSGPRPGDKRASKAACAPSPPNRLAIEMARRVPRRPAPSAMRLGPQTEVIPPARRASPSPPRPPTIQPSRGPTDALPAPPRATRLDTPRGASNEGAGSRGPAGDRDGLERPTASIRSTGPRRTTISPIANPALPEWPTRAVTHGGASGP